MRISDWSSDVCSSDLLLCALAPTLRRGVDRSSSTRFRAGCGLEGPQLPLRSMRSQVDCAALPDLRRAMWPLRPCLRPWPCPSLSSELSGSEPRFDPHSRTLLAVRSFSYLSYLNVPADLLLGKEFFHIF